MRSDGDEKRGWSSSWFTAGMAVLTCTPTGAHQHAAHRDGGCGQGQATPGPESAQKQARRVGQRDAIGTVHSTRAKERARSPPSRPAAPGNSSKRRCTCTSWPPGPPPAPPKCSHGLPERDKTASRQVARGRAGGTDGAPTGNRRGCGHGGVGRSRTAAGSGGRGPGVAPFFSLSPPPALLAAQAFSHLCSTAVGTHDVLRPTACADEDATLRQEDEAKLRHDDDEATLRHDDAKWQSSHRAARKAVRSSSV